MISRPVAFNSVASAVIAMVGDGLTRARRSARKGMTSLYLDQKRVMLTYGQNPLFGKSSLAIPTRIALERIEPHQPAHSAGLGAGTARARSPQRSGKWEAAPVLIRSPI